MILVPGLCVQAFSTESGQTWRPLILFGLSSLPLACRHIHSATSYWKTQLYFGQSKQFPKDPSQSQEKVQLQRETSAYLQITCVRAYRKPAREETKQVRKATQDFQKAAKGKNLPLRPWNPQLS